MVDYFLGLDVGTKNIKGVILTDEGKIIERKKIAVYDLLYQPRENYVERDPKLLWQKVVNLLKDMRYIDRISGLCVDATSGSFTQIDEDGNELYRIIMYNDSRAIKEAEELRKKSQKARDFERYLPITPTLVLPKLMWLKNNFSDFYKVYKILHESDYIVYKLTGETVTSPNVAGKAHALLDGLGYLEEAYSDVDIPIKIMPEVRKIGDVIGYTTERIMNEIGIPKSTPVINGMTDASSSDVSSGVFSNGQANVTIGTSLTVHAVVKNLVPDKHKRFYYKAYLNNLFLAGGFTNAGTPIFDTFSKITSKSLDELTSQAAKVEPGSGGLISCNELFGVRVPQSFPNVKGFIIGLSEKNFTYGHVFRSFLESSGYALKLMLDAIEETTKVTINDLRISGGASRNDLLLQIIADITGREVKAVYEPDAAIGSVILAMANITRKNLEKIAEKTIKIRASYLPNQEHYETYIKLVEKYKEIIFSLNKIFS